jgi:hypothetical protein
VHARRLLAGPTVLLAASVVHPPHGLDGDSWFAAASAASVRFYLVHVLFLAAAVAVIPAAEVMADILRAAGVRRNRAAATLTSVGALGIAAFVGTDLFVWRMAHGAANRSEMLVFLRDAASSPAVVGPMAVLMAAVALGAALFAIQLWRAKAIGVAPAAMVVVGPLLFGVLPVKAVSVAGAVSLLVGLAAVARAADAQKQTAAEARSWGPARRTRESQPVLAARAATEGAE